MITARMLLDRMTPSTILALLQDMREVEDDQDDDAVRRELIVQLGCLVGLEDASELLWQEKIRLPV